jgi:threonine aldolase
VYQTAAYTRSVGDLAHQQGIMLHLDGARIFNAAVAQGVQVKDLVDPVDSVTFCLSKGLCAPVGSVLCGSNDFIRRAHRIRKQLGGGMRQAGILAAAGIVALETIVPRLGEDHARARRLAEGLCTIPGIVMDLGMPQSNMVFCALDKNVPWDAHQVVTALLKYGVRVGAVEARHFRLVTHYWISDNDVESAINAFTSVLKCEPTAS